MAKVIQLRKKDARPSETMVLLVELMDLEKKGKLNGFMPILDTGGETHFRIIGSFAGRLQFAGYTLIKSLNALTDRLADAGTAGHTSSPAVHEVVRTSSAKRSKARPTVGRIGEPQT